jgi:two-component system, OmpR family, sensor histidine kinase VicK
MKLKDIPLQRKLMSVILLTCTVVLFLICSAYIILEYSSSKDILKNKVSTLGVVVAANSSAAVAFDSQRDAIEILNALKADKHIVAAALYDQEGNLFATYPEKIPQRLLPTRPEAGGYEFRDDHLIGFEPVVQANQRLGTLFIKSDMQAVHIQVNRFILIAFLLIAGSLVIAYLLSHQLQKSISEPILALENTAKVISGTKDYSIRAVKSGQDEIGSLTDNFNEMLTQIQFQNQEIIKSKEQSSKLAAIVESSGDAIIANNLDQKITSWNNSASTMLGYSAEEMLGQSIMNLIPAGSVKLEHRFQELMQRGEKIDPVQIQVITKDQRLLDLSLTISPIKDAEGNIVGISQIARNITAEKQNERLLSDREEHLRLAVQAAELGTFDMNVVSGFIKWDPRCKELLGIYKDASDGANEQTFDGANENDEGRISKILKHVVSRDRADGNYNADYRITGFNNKVRWVRVKGKMFFDMEGNPVRFLGAVLDITGMKQEELRKNDFIAIISHELKTPLTAIKSYIQILLGKAKKDGDIFETNALVRAEAQTIRITSMINDFLNLARIEEGKLRINKEVFSLDNWLEDILSEAAFLTSNHQLNIVPCEGVQVYADKDKICQVLVNLISNATKYSHPGTTVDIGCEKVNGSVRFYVKDQGIGINPEHVDKLFNRFYRVENEQMKTVSGFGIGLYLVSEILRYHNSRIDVESQEGRGSTFSFVLDAV